MKKTLAVLAVAALTTAARAGYAQQVVYVAPPPPPPVYGPPPPSGLGLIITGSIFTAIGGVNLVTAPLCETSVFASNPQSNTQTLCLGLSLGIGITAAVIGIPMLVVGVNRRNAYREWKQAGGVVARLTDLGITPVPGGTALTWHADF
jgi:hypothetical protein